MGVHVLLIAQSSCFPVQSAILGPLQSYRTLGPAPSSQNGALRHAFSVSSHLVLGAEIAWLMPTHRIVGSQPVVLPCFAAAASPSPDPFANINAMITQAAQANNNAVIGTNAAVSTFCSGEGACQP